MRAWSRETDGWSSEYVTLLGDRPREMKERWPKSWKSVPWFI